MKPPFQRILPILKGVLVVCGILFVLQWVVGMLARSEPPPTTRQVQASLQRPLWVVLVVNVTGMPGLECPAQQG